jgi:hypothetical protein
VSADETSPPKHRTLRQVAGVCGLLGAIVALSFVGLAIVYSPGNFSITQNWLSDLGGMGYTAFENVTRPSVTSPTTALLFDSGLAVAGILGIIFSLGLLSDAHSPAYRLGAVCTLLGAAAIAGGWSLARAAWRRTYRCKLRLWDILRGSYVPRWRLACRFFRKAFRGVFNRPRHRRSGRYLSNQLRAGRR